MNSRQSHILGALSSVAVGAMAFCLTMPAAMLLVGIIFSPWLQADGLFTAGLVVLLLVSSLAGLAVAVLAGRKYYRYEKQRRDQFQESEIKNC